MKKTLEKHYEKASENKNGVLELLTGSTAVGGYGKLVKIGKNRECGLLIATLLILLFSYSCKYTSRETTIMEEAIAPIYHYGFNVNSLSVNEYQITSGDNMSLIFNRLGFSSMEADRIVRSCRDILDPSRLQVGRSYMTYTTQDSIPQIQYIVFSKSLTDHAVIDFTNDTVSAYLYKKDITLKRNYVEGEISSSLWNSLVAQDVDSRLAIDIADIYAWTVDFFDVKAGDSYQVLYDESYIDDTTKIRIDAIQGAVFNYQGKDFIAIPFIQDGILEYFDEEGNSLRKAFLKAPLDFFRITSHFTNSRFHPVLKRYRAHHGVDYAAPVGTPVKSIGAGVVISKGYQAGGGGNYVRVKHNSVYTTVYMHLSKFPQGIQVGKRVQQGEVIGYVGSTGLSTGPHLDFRVYKNGSPINPLTMEAPPSEPVKPELRDSFLIVKDRVLAELHFRKQQPVADNQQPTVLP